MTGASIYYLAVSGGLFLIFLGIGIHLYRRGRKDHVEAPKYRMLDDDCEPEDRP